MKTALLLALTALIAPAAWVAARAVARESWGGLTVAGAVLALAVIGIRFLLGGF